MVAFVIVIIDVVVATVVVDFTTDVLKVRMKLRDMNLELNISSQSEQLVVNQGPRT